MGELWVFWGVRSRRGSSAHVTTPVARGTARITSSASEIINLSTDVAKLGPARKKLIRGRLFIKAETSAEKGRDQDG